MNQVTKTKEVERKPEYPEGVISNWREFDEKRLDVEREWQPGDEVPSLEVTDEFFRVICKDKNAPDCVTYGGQSSKKPGAFPGFFVYRYGKREAYERDLNMPIEQFHIKQVEMAKVKHQEELLKKRAAGRK